MNELALQPVRSGTALPPVLRRTYNSAMPGDIAESGESETGLRQLLVGMRPELVRFMLARKCDPADVEDLLQDLYVKLANTQTGPVRNARAYLYQMANNLLHDHRRGRLRQEGRDDGWARSRFGQDLDRDPDPSPEQIAIDRDELQRVEEALAAMPERTAMILKLYRVEGLTQKAIASRYDISLSAVEKHLQRAYRSIMKLRSDFDAERARGEKEAGDVYSS